MCLWTVRKPISGSVNGTHERAWLIMIEYRDTKDWQEARTLISQSDSGLGVQLMSVCMYEYVLRTCCKICIYAHIWLQLSTHMGVGVYVCVDLALITERAYCALNIIITETVNEMFPMESSCYLIFMLR